MATIKGQNLRVLVDNKCIAQATSCTFHIAARVEESSTKDDTGDFAQNEITGLSWDASTDSLVTLTDNGTKVFREHIARLRESTQEKGKQGGLDDLLRAKREKLLSSKPPKDPS